MISIMRLTMALNLKFMLNLLWRYRVRVAWFKDTIFNPITKRVNQVQPPIFPYLKTAKNRRP
jgi:hypothetical protein